MNTIKSGAVIVVMLGLLYGVFVALNKPEPAPPAGFSQQQVEQLGPPQVEIVPLPTSSNELAGEPSPYAQSTLPKDTHPVRSDIASVNHQGTDATRSPAPDAPRSPLPDSLDSTKSAQSSADSSSVYQRSTFESPLPAAQATQSAKLTAYSFRQTWQAADGQIAAGKFREALAGLSPFYNHPDLSAEERAQLTAWLDALAGKVIYSTQHALERPYEIRGERQTLFDIAERCHVPSDLLLNINRDVVSDPMVIVPGTVLKVVPGPFRAEVNLTTSELTLYLGDLYAGRFPFTVGNEPPQPGEHKVADKRTDRTYYGADRTIPAGDPANPFGGYWIDLGHEVCIHGSPTSANDRSATLGCISLSPQDARDVYGILSRGSNVVIKR